MKTTNKIDFIATKVFNTIWLAVQSLLYKLIVEEGSSRSSKTWSNFQVIFLYLYQNPMTTCTILRDTQKSCREIVETDWIKWVSDPMGRKMQLEKGEITIHEFDALLKKENLTQYFIRNKTNHTWTFKHNDSFIRFTGLDDEDDAMGMTQDVCWINEPYKFSHEVYKQLAQRTSKFILADWNPKQKHWLDDEKKKDSTTTLHSTFRDNPFCPVESKKQILSYQSVKYADVVVSGIISENDARLYDCEANRLLFMPKQIKELIRCIYNEYVNSASDYHYAVYALGLKAEKPNRIFKNWIKISDHDFDALTYNSYYGLDFGTTNPSALIEVKYNDGCFYIRKRLYLPISQMPEGGITNAFDTIGLNKSDIIIADSADKDNRKDIQRNGYNIIGAKKGPASVVGGINLMNKYKVYFVDDAELEYEYENYEWEIFNGMNLERPIKKDDHLLDATRYIITWLCTYLNIK